MPTSSSGTMTPIVGGVPGAVTSAYPLPYTLLSLFRFARMVGIAPVHFAGASAPSLNPQVFPIGSACGDVWPRYDWQKNDQVSHEGLAYAIKDAEESLAREVHFFAAPMWIAGEKQDYPGDFYRDGYSSPYNVKGALKGLTANYGRIIGGGQRGATLLATATTIGGSLSYHDNDGDGLYETANIQIAGLSASLTDVCEIKVYFAGYGGQQEWEIRPERAKSILGGNLLMVFDSWLFIDPAILSHYPTDDGFQAVDISDVSKFVTSVEVYRIYNDQTQPSAILKWENISSTCRICGGTGCAVCSDTEQDGCIQVRDPNLGIIVPVPATYDTSWTATSFDVCRAPDKVELYYQAGDMSNEYLRGISCDPLSDMWAWCIIWLAIARLERPPCSCNRLKDMFDYLREDLAHSTSAGSYFEGIELTTNPFGTHRGELMAWKRVKHHVEKRPSVAVI